MQHAKFRRSNRERSETMRAELITAARRLFTRGSYAETSTPDIAQAAGVTRGALYHHFADKQALLLAVIEAEAEAVAAEIETETPPDMPVIRQLSEGAATYLRAMAVPGRTRLLLLDGPAVLGRTVMDDIDSRHAARTLREGLAQAMDEGAISALPLDALTSLLSATFDRAALAIEGGDVASDYAEVLDRIIAGLLQPPR
ncbi:helix-turn-helix domain-containing protein [Agrobacterium cavarae]|uniref:helix-turn-helix domain-containing protein n=1 Tax=Agrobacterium cavarae TaxID=2528239 RepID=UPI003FD0E934